MKTRFEQIKSRFLPAGSTVSGAMGALGSVHNVCHSVCVAIVSLLSLVGISLSILPLMFLQTYQAYFWFAAFVFTLLALRFYVLQPQRPAHNRNWLLLNSGFLLFGLPFRQLADYMDFFRFVGISLVLIGLLLFMFGKKIKVVYRHPGHLIPSPAAAGNAAVTTPTAVTTLAAPKLSFRSLLFGLVIVSFLINQYLLWQTLRGPGAATAVSSGPMGATLSRMRLTPFDVALAKERMDKDNDGACDVCGMSIDQCISSGQLDCNMGGNKEAIGVLGTQHVHADWKIYVNGQALDSTFFDPLAMDMSNPNKQTTSSFIHVDKGAPAPEKTGDVIHMHAKNVPLWVFFRSVGMNLTKDSLTLADGQALKSENGRTLKFYLNGQKVDELNKYVFQDLDKLLISYGPENNAEIDRQLNSITNFSKDH